jgi:hypothetical protein
MESMVVSSGNAGKGGGGEETLPEAALALALTYLSRLLLVSYWYIFKETDASSRFIRGY